MVSKKHTKSNFPCLKTLLILHFMFYIYFKCLGNKEKEETRQDNIKKKKGNKPIDSIYLQKSREKKKSKQNKKRKKFEFYLKREKNWKKRE